MSRRQQGGLAVASTVGIALLAGVTEFLVREDLDITLYVALTGLLILGLSLRFSNVHLHTLPLSPAALVLLFGVLSVACVPLLWGLGLATPWDSWEPEKFVATVTYGLLGLAAVATGAATAPMPTHVRRVAVGLSSRRLAVVLAAGITAGLLGYFLIARAAGGPLALIQGLTARRELLAGTGPLRVLLYMAAAACILGVLTDEKQRLARALTWVAGAVFLLGVLATGSRFEALIVVIASWSALARQGRLRARHVYVPAAIIVPASVAYLYNVRQELSVGASQGEISLAGPVSFLRSVLDPFIASALDALRTVQVVIEAPVFSWRSDALSGNLLGPVPRSVYPFKPDGTSLAFSKEYFPQAWSDGTGIPPSLMAESYFLFGIAGGLLALTILGALLAIVGRLLLASSSYFSAMTLSFLAADAILLARAGVDSMLKSLLLQLLAVVAIAFLARSGKRRRGGIDRPSKEKALVRY